MHTGLASRCSPGGVLGVCSWQSSDGRLLQLKLRSGCDFSPELTRPCCYRVRPVEAKFKPTFFKEEVRCLTSAAWIKLCSLLSVEGPECECLQQAIR